MKKKIKQSIKKPKILLLDFIPGCGLGGKLREILESSFSLGVQLQLESVEVRRPAFSDSDLSRIISRFNPDVIFLVLSPRLQEEFSGLSQFMKIELSKTPIVVVAEVGKPDEIFALLKLGVADFITPPLKTINVLPRIWRLLEQTRRGDVLTQSLKEKIGLNQLIGESPVFLAEIKKIPAVAKSDTSVLISGETGTGKELCARAIHYLSLRAHQPFLPVNCGAIPAELVENELFGHEPGAFTGASTSQPGLIYEADGGTLFLDEIDCLPLSSQVKLLRFLQEKEYRRLGSTKLLQANVRVIAATNVEVEEAVRGGKLRLDLYYRLNVIPLMLPPLRERREDIPLLARHFLAKYASQFNKPAMDFSSDAMQELIVYEWRGNVRELEHVIERAIVLSEQAIIRNTGIVLPRRGSTVRQESFQAAKARIITQFERSYIQGLLSTYRGNISRSAQAAQKNRRAFWQLLRKHQIDVQRFKQGSSM